MERLSDYLREQARIVGAATSDTDVDAVHDARVAIRRLRSALRVFEPLVEDVDAAHQLDDELRWLAGMFGDVRDRQVLRKRFAESPLETGFVEKMLYDEQARCEKALRRALRSERFEALRERLAGWAEASPVRGESEDSLDDCARAAARKARRRLRAADTDAELHRARKSAKRARYAAEMLEHPHRATRFRHVQDLLGELQDTVVAGETLRRLMRGASREETFILGALYGRELDQRDRLRLEARALTE